MSASTLPDDRNAVIARVLPDYAGWLHRTAYDLLPPDSPDHDDLVQEGMVAMWRAFDTFDPAKGALPAYLTLRARGRMTELRNQRGHWLTSEPRPFNGGATAKGDEKRERIRRYLADYVREHGRKPTVAVAAKDLGISAGNYSTQVRKLGQVQGGVTRVDSIDALSAADDRLWGGAETSNDSWHPEDVDSIAAADAAMLAYHHGEIAEALDRLTPAQRRYVDLRFWHGMNSTELADAFGYSPHALWRTARERLADDLAHLDGELVPA